MTRLRDVKGLWSFQGLVSYMFKLQPLVASVSFSLGDLLKEDKVLNTWGLQKLTKHSTWNIQ